MTPGTLWLTPHLIDCSVTSRVVVMVQWLTHPTSIQGDVGSIPTHGTYLFFHSKRRTVSSSLSLFLNSLLTHLSSKALCILWILLASDYIVGMPASLIQITRDFKFFFAWTCANTTGLWSRNAGSQGFSLRFVRAIEPLQEPTFFAVSKWLARPWSSND